MKTRRAWLIVKANGDMRVRTRRPYDLHYDEIAVLVVVNIPDAWGMVQTGSIEVIMPPPPEIEVQGEGDSVAVKMP